MSAKKVDVVRSYRSRKRFQLTDGQFAYLLIVPTLVLIGFVILIPLILSVRRSFLDYSVINPAQSTWNNFKHYRALITGPDFWNSLKASGFFMAGVVGLQFVIGFSVALVVNSGIPKRNLFRGIFLIPWVVPKIVAAWLWKWMYAVEYGLVIYLFSVIGLTDLSLDMWADPKYAMMAVVWATVWRGASFDMVMLLAGLQGIPRDLYDAVAVDGGGLIQQFRHIVLPAMRNIISVVLIITTVWSAQNFTMIWATTQGGPVSATDTLPIFIYREGFRFLRFDYGAAAGTILLGMLLCMAILWIRVAVKKAET